MRILRLLPTLAEGAFACLLAGCLFTTAGGFAGGRDENVCDSTVPVCSTSGGCVLDEDHYLAGNYPGARRFIVRTRGQAVITLTVYFTEARSPGADSNFYIYETGCVERFAYETAGRDIFREAGPDMQFSFSARVYQGGDHLVEVNSDAVSEYFLIADVEEIES
jgi:hypothetical protein